MAIMSFLCDTVDGKGETSWWFQPIFKILVKLDHFPKDRGENKKYLKPPPRT